MNTKPYTNTFNNTLVNGVINPLRRDRVFTNLHFNTKYRDNYIKSSSSNFHYTLPQSFDNVVSIKLSSISIPNTWYTFSEVLKNNRFSIMVEDTISLVVSVEEIIIPDGTYSITQLEDFLNDNYFYNSSSTTLLQYVKFSISHTNFKTKFELLATSMNPLKMDLFFVDEFSDTQDIMYNAGWILGFRSEQYINIENYIISEGLYDNDGDKYLYFCLSDFNKNVSNNNIVLFGNSTMKNDVLAKVYLKDGKFTVNIDDMNSNCCSYVKTRRYFGPITLKKIHIKLIDQYGRIIDLNNMDYSFSLEIEEKYDS